MAANGGHANSTKIHVICNWEYADAAAREAATGFTDADVGKFAWQLDDNSVWMLADADQACSLGALWIPVGLKAMLDLDAHGGAFGSGDKLLVNNSGSLVTVDYDDLPGGTSPLFSSIAVIREEQASGTNGGTFTSGSYRTRVLNTEHYDPDGIVTISSNQFTPVAGNYYIVASAPGYQSGQHKAKLYNATGAADVIIGTSEQSGGTNFNQTRSLVIGKFTANGTDAYEIQHRCTSTTTNTGFGYPSAFGDVEVYTNVTLLKLA